MEFCYLESIPHFNSSSQVLLKAGERSWISNLRRQHFDIVLFAVRVFEVVGWDINYEKL